MGSLRDGGNLSFKDMSDEALKICSEVRRKRGKGIATSKIRALADAFLFQNGALEEVLNLIKSPGDEEEFQDKLDEWIGRYTEAQ